MVAVVGRAAEIKDALYTHALLMETEGPTLPVSVPNPKTAFDPPTDSPYLQARALPNRPRSEGLSAGRLDQGMFMIDVVVPRGAGEIEPAVIAQKVIDHFAKGTRLVSGGTAIRIDKEGWVAPEIPGGAASIHPVTLYYVRAV